MRTTLRLVLLSALAQFLGTGGLATAAQRASAPTEDGPRLSYEVRSREVENALEVVTCVLRAKGFPETKKYALAAKWMNGRTADVQKGLRIDEAGRVLGQDGDEVELALASMHLGEYIVFLLSSEDGAAKAKVEITPFPIEAEGPGGCRLNVQLTTTSGEMFVITGSGFRPGEDLKTKSKSSDEAAETTMKGRPDGTLKVVMFPAVVGRTGGDASFEASDSVCSVKVNYKWGDAMAANDPPAPRTPPSSP